MKIGDRIFVRGYIDEIRKDTVIVRNDGGYFGTIPSEVITGELPSAQPKSYREGYQAGYKDAQSKTAERIAETAQNVSDEDLISRKAAIDAIRASTSKYTGFMEMEMYTDDDAVEAIEDLSSAQPEIIHCCECQHWKQGELVDKCGLLDCYADADCYCAWAVRERRQDEQTD